MPSPTELSDLLEPSAAAGIVFPDRAIFLRIAGPSSIPELLSKVALIQYLVSIIHSGLPLA